MRLHIALGSVTIAAFFTLAQACGDDTEITPVVDGADASDDVTTTPPGNGSSGGTDAATDAPTGDAATDAPTDKSAMTFFVTSTGSGAMGGNLGGLAGADKKCQDLATAVGGGDHTWRAYLSTNTNDGGQLVNAKDRIGPGPWQNQAGTVIAASVAALHADGFNVPGAAILDETGAVVPAAQHDILTGTNRDGTAVTAAPTNNNCQNWTSNTTNVGPMVGHSDSDTTANQNDTWNNAHVVNQQGPNAGCSQARLTATAGAGRVYCFAAD
jgi:hypothetical protein